MEPLAIDLGSMILFLCLYHFHSSTGYMLTQAPALS